MAEVDSSLVTESLGNAYNLTSTQLADTFALLERSDNPAAQALVSVANHPRLHEYYHKATDLLIRNLSIVVSLLGLVAHLWISDLARQRNIRKQNTRILQQRIDNGEMSNYGLGTPSAAGANGAKSGDGFGQVEVQWGREKLRVPLPPPTSPLSSFKATLYNITGVPPDHQKLIFSGAVLKDDLAPMSSYQLVDDVPIPSAADSEGAKTSFWDTWSFTGRGSNKKLKKLVMLGSKDVSARVDDRLTTRKDLVALAAEAAAPAEIKVEDEETVQRRIKENSSDRLVDLEPKVERVEAYIKQEQQKKAGKAPALAEGEEELSAPQPRTLLFLSENLLQSLLRLDSIEIQSSYAAARAERKEAVKRVQGVLDRVDVAKEAMKSLGQ